MRFDEFIKHFQGAQRRGKHTVNVICPCHPDNNPSLSISEGNDRILMHCQTECNYKDILAAVGLKESDLFYNEKVKPEKTWRDKLLDERQYRGKTIEAVYDYTDAKGKYLYSKIRFTGKVIRYFTIDYKNDTYQTGKPEGVSTLYNLPATLKAIKKGFPVYITEGEKDANTLKDLGFTATTAGSVSDWKKSYAKYFIGAKVVILPDNDVPGLELKDKITKDLRPFAHSVKSVITSKADKGDVTDYMAEGHTKEELQALINEVSAIVAPWIEITEKKDGTTKQRVNPGLLKACISEHLSYKCIDGIFYWYANGYYKKADKHNVKAKIAAYIPNGIANDNLLNNVYNLMLADFDHMAEEKEFNECEDYINFRNGLYNINTGTLEPHDSNILYSRQVNTDYIADATDKPVFDKFINDLCRNSSGDIDTEKRDALAEIAGLAISNVYGHRTKKAAILYSPVGNTGKSQFLALLGALIGADNIITVPLQNMNEDKGRFAFANAGLIRLIMNGDQGKSTIKDSSVFKAASGGDYIKAEGKGKDIKSLVFKGFIIIACNDLPYIADDKGDHIYRRLYIVPCTHEVPEKDRDPNILSKMRKELPAIANWAIESLHRLKNNRYNFSDIAAGKEYIENYRKSSDTVFSFLMDEGYIITKDPKDKVVKSELFTAYKNYCIANERIQAGVQQFGERITKLTGYPIVRTFVNNMRDYFVQGIKMDNDGFRAATYEQENIFNNTG